MKMMWASKPLEDFSRLRNGKSIKPHASGKYPVYGSNGVIGSTDEFMYEAAIILGRVGAYCGSVKLSVGKFWASDNTIIVEANPAEADLWFLYYLLKDAKLNQHAGGAAQPLLTQSRLKLLVFSVPPLSTQRKVSSILSAYDDLIENNNRQIEILEEMARRLYEEWFVHFRFPGHEEASFKDSELGRIPEGWTVNELGSVAQINPEAIKPKYSPDDIHYVDISSVSPGRIDKTEKMRFSDAPGRARRIVRSGDIICACVRPNRRLCAMVVDPKKDTVVSTGFAVLRAASISEHYLYQHVQAEQFVNYLVNRATGAAYPAVKAYDFNEAKIMEPQGDLLPRFDEAVGPMRRLVHKLERKNNNLRAQRDLLLPKLVSGEIDVSDLSMPDDKEIAAA